MILIKYLYTPPSPPHLPALLHQPTQQKQSCAAEVCDLCFRSIIFGPPGNTKGPLLFFLVSVLLWGYPMYIFKVGGGLWWPCITGSFINLCWELPQRTTVIVASANSHNIVLLLLRLGHWDSRIIEIQGHWDSWVIKSLGHWDYCVTILDHWDSWVIKILDHWDPWVIIVGHLKCSLQSVL